MSSVGASQITAGNGIWDMTLPWFEWQRDVTTLKRFHRAGVGFVSLTVMDLQTTLSGIRSGVEATCNMAKQASDWLTVGRSVAEIDRGVREGKLVVGFNVQDSVQFGTELGDVGTLRALGIRHMQIVYQTRNFAADGCAEPTNAGLSIFGRRLVREMNRVGLIVDCSHAGCRSSLEAIDLAELPPIFSHSNPYVLCPHIRNITDEQIRACAAKDGVIGVNGIGAFLGDTSASIESMYRHIDYIAQLVGPRHVGIGTDFLADLEGSWPYMRANVETSWPDPTGTQLMEGDCFQPEQHLELIEFLSKRGYSEEHLKGLFSGNFRRVYQIADAAVPAESLQES